MKSFVDLLSGLLSVVLRLFSVTVGSVAPTFLFSVISALHSVTSSLSWGFVFVWLELALNLVSSISQVFLALLDVALFAVRLDVLREFVGEILSSRVRHDYGTCCKCLF